MAFRWAATGLVVLLTLAACAVTPALLGDAEPFKPIEHPGVWVSDGYGYVLEVAGDRTRLFHATRKTCVEEKDLSDSILPHLDRVRRSVDGQQLAVSSVLDPYEYTFRRRASLPTHCLTPPPNTPLGNFDAFADYFAEHYAFFDLLRVDWSARARESRAKVSAGTSERELFEVLRALIAPLKDGHIKLEAKIDGKALVHDGKPSTLELRFAEIARQKNLDPRRLRGDFRRAYWFEGIQKTLLAGKGRVAANGRIQYGLVSQNVGYVAFVSMGGYVDGKIESLHRELPALDAAMEDALALFLSEGVKAVIVDVSLNSGGYDFIAAAIAGRFATSPTLAYKKRAADNPHGVDFPIRTRPSNGKRFTGPVYLLTSELTVSAAEVLALHLRGLGNVTHVGQPTRGGFSTVLTKYLPNGWVVSLSNEIYTDHRGELWEGRGIAPDIMLPVFNADAPNDGHTEAVRSLTRLIDQRVPET